MFRLKRKLDRFQQVNQSQSPQTSSSRLKRKLDGFQQVNQSQSPQTSSSNVENVASLINKINDAAYKADNNTIPDILGKIIDEISDSHNSTRKHHEVRQLTLHTYNRFDYGILRREAELRNKIVSQLEGLNALMRSLPDAPSAPADRFKCLVEDLNNYLLYHSINFDNVTYSFLDDLTEAIELVKINQFLDLKILQPIIDQFKEKLSQLDTFKKSIAVQFEYETLTEIKSLQLEVAKCYAVLSTIIRHDNITQQLNSIDFIKHQKEIAELNDKILKFLNENDNVIMNGLEAEIQNANRITNGYKICADNRADAIIKFFKDIRDNNVHLISQHPEQIIACVKYAKRIFPIDSDVRKSLREELFILIREVKKIVQKIEKDNISQKLAQISTINELRTSMDLSNLEQYSKNVLVAIAEKMNLLLDDAEQIAARLPT